MDTLQFFFIAWITNLGVSLDGLRIFKQTNQRHVCHKMTLDNLRTLLFHNSLSRVYSKNNFQNSTVYIKIFNRWRRAIYFSIFMTAKTQVS
jgi:hypothetical protein